MGTSLDIHNVSCTIRAPQVPAALAALKALAATAHLAWVRAEEVLAADSLDEALTACRWESEIEGADSLALSAFTGEKYGSEDEIFGALAPFVTTGSFIEGEAEGERFRWVFTGQRVLIQTPTITYPAIPRDVPAPVRPADGTNEKRG